LMIVFLGFESLEEHAWGFPISLNGKLLGIVSDVKLFPLKHALVLVSTTCEKPTLLFGFSEIPADTKVMIEKIPILLVRVPYIWSEYQETQTERTEHSASNKRVCAPCKAYQTTSRWFPHTQVSLQYRRGVKHFS